MPKQLLCVFATWFLCQAVAFAQTSTAAKPTPAATPALTVSSTTSTTSTQKPISAGEIYRWVDSQGKVQYSADVPEDRRFTARKVDTRSNIVSSRVPASVQGAPKPQPQSEPSESAPAVRQPITVREKCEADWKLYTEAQACFAKYRQSTVAGGGNRSGGNISSEAQEKCQSLTEPAACR